MEKSIILNNLKLEILQGDITSQNVDGIVNAANRHLEHGSGVAGAILANGGEIIWQESQEWINQYGEVTHDHPAVTSGGLLPCKYVIHAVGPIWGEGNEVSKLETAILSSLKVANNLKCNSVAIPAISTGIYGFPIPEAARCFYNAILIFSRLPDTIYLRNIRIVLFDQIALQIFLDTFSQ